MFKLAVQAVTLLFIEVGFWFGCVLLFSPVLLYIKLLAHCFNNLRFC